MFSNVLSVYTFIEWTKRTMTFYRELYCDEDIKKKKKKIIRKIRKNAGQLGVYVIALSKGSDIFDIFHVGMLKQKYFPKEDLHIIGLASSYDMAIKLAANMVMDFFSAYGTWQFKEKLLFLEESKWHSF